MCGPPASRGFWGAICFAGANGGTALGAGVAALLRQLLDDPKIYDNILGRGTLLQILAWRLCFWSGLLIGLLGIWIRRGLGAEQLEKDAHGSPEGTSSLDESVTTGFEACAPISAEKPPSGSGRGRGGGDSGGGSGGGGSVADDDACGAPIRRAVGHHWSSILLVMGHVSIWSTTFYVS